MTAAKGFDSCFHAMHQYVVYWSPRDYRGKYVARRWDIIRGVGPLATTEVYTADSLEAIRMKVPPFLIRLPRYPEDDPCIVEVWI